MGFERFKKYYIIDYQITTYKSACFWLVFSFNQTARFPFYQENRAAVYTKIRNILLNT